MARRYGHIDGGEYSVAWTGASQQSESFKAGGIYASEVSSVWRGEAGAMPKRQPQKGKAGGNVEEARLVLRQS